MADIYRRSGLLDESRHLLLNTQLLSLIEVSPPQLILHSLQGFYRLLVDLLLVIIIGLQSPSWRLLFNFALFVFGLGHFQVESFHDAAQHLIVDVLDISGGVDCVFVLFVVGQSPADDGVVGERF